MRALWTRRGLLHRARTDADFGSPGKSRSWKSRNSSRRTSGPYGLRFKPRAGPTQANGFTKLVGRDQDRFDQEEDAKALANKLSGLPGNVASVTSKTEKKKPDLLYDLTNLQKEANKRFGFTAEHTLDSGAGAL